MALRYPEIIRSNSPRDFGVIDAKEATGHKVVSDLDELYELTEKQLYPSDLLVETSGTTIHPAIGQMWYVTEENSHYVLTNWANRDSASGWQKIDLLYAYQNSLDTIYIQEEGREHIEIAWDGPEAGGSQSHNFTISGATQDKAGLLTAADKVKLDALRNVNDLANIATLVGVTTSDIADNGTTNPIQINNQSYRAKKGDIVFKGRKEFIWDGSQWILLGDTTTVHNLIESTSSGVPGVTDLKCLELSVS